MDDAPAELESLPSQIPDSFTDDPYFALNDGYAQRIAEATAQIDALSAEMEPWQVASCRLRAEGKAIAAIAKECRKKNTPIETFLRTLGAKQLVSHFSCLSILKKPIPKNMRAHMLWRIAVDNEKIAPDVSRKALNDLNAMLDPKGGGSGGQTLQIVINNDVLPKGALDG